jgi:3-hydroxybutyryl-CoA dehydratase
MPSSDLLTKPYDELEVGDRFESPGRTITETDLVAFAALTGDRHPLHVDAEWAAQSQFGGRIAHGALVLSYGLGLVPLSPEYALALRALRQVIFRKPVRLGDTIKLTGQINRKVDIDAGTGLVSMRMAVGPKEHPAACVFLADVVWRRAGIPDDGGQGAPDEQGQGGPDDGGQASPGR